ncbi:MAG: DUF4350 domain-containing protein [Pedobacter sp.]|nr:MAG: DUF4350 domain-containing protein [Pedobacter sp.]
MKGLKSYFLISILFMLVYIVAQYNKPQPTNWNATYLKEDKIPFGTHILYKEIGSIFPNSTIRVSQQRIYNTLKDNRYQGTSYLIVAGSLKLDSLDYQQLVGYMKRGNDVFIAATDLGRTLYTSLKIKTRANFTINNNRVVYSNFTNPSLKAENAYAFKRDIGSQFFSAFDTSKVTVLGRNAKEQVNFIRYSFGKGNLYLLPNPRILTNYSLLDPDRAEYAAKALSYLKQSETVLWDESNTRVNELDSSILRVILRNPPLKWAYYLALISLLLFVFFEMKRRQRIIPVVEPLLNTSVAFVKVVGRVYYQQRDNRDIATKKVNYFFEFVRSNYRLKTTVLDAEFVNDLVHKSGVGHEGISSLVSNIHQIQNGQKVTDGVLIQLNKLIEQFYKQAQH